MKGKIVKALWMTCFILILMASIALAQTPANTILYQGKLTDDAGAPITTEVPVTFVIWSLPAGGTSLYSQATPITPDANGLFTVELGPVGPDVLNGDKRYLAMTVDGELMTPRQVLTSAPAAHASFAGPGVAFKAGGSHNVDTSLVVTVFDSIQVYAPTEGFIHVTSSMTARINHENTLTGEEFYYQVSQNTETISYGQYGFEWISFDNDWPIDTYYFPLSTSKVFPVDTSGTYTFYGKGKMFYGGDPYDGVYNHSLTAVFYPKAYGVVSAFGKSDEGKSDIPASATGSQK